MARIWVYHGSPIYLATSGGSTRIVQGQYLYEVKKAWDYTEFDVWNSSTKTWKRYTMSGQPSEEGHYKLRTSSGSYVYGIYRLDEYNHKMYGSSWAYAGGSKYTLRYGARLYDANRNYTGIYLSAGWKVIIGEGQGYTMINTRDWNFQYIRCWGYIDGSGRVRETSGLFIQDPGNNHPDYYRINSK
nr:hypothetical protein 34 [Bacillaceae bacterium]